MTQSDRPPRHCYLAYRFHLPYRVFLDDGIYFVADGQARWRVSLRSAPQTAITFTTPPIDFGPRAQLHLDNHGYSGATEVVAAYPLSPPLTKAEVVARQAGLQRITLVDVLRPINRLIGLYRAKTWEYWFRALGPTDVPAYSVFLLPEGSSEGHWWTTSTNVKIASGYPYLKTERWYEDLLGRCERGEAVPFLLELAAEGRDALARDNLRLAAVNFALAAEALFRALLQQYFPASDTTRPVLQMLGSYFSHYREIGDPARLPISKKQARERLDTIWSPRDQLMHGHEVRLARPAVEASESALLELLQLWFARPGADQFIVEGPFVDFGSPDFPSRNVEDLVARARNRLAGGHIFDAEEAARYAMGLDPNNAHVPAILGVIAAKRGQWQEAAELLERAVALDPALPGVAQDLAAVRARVHR